MFGDELELSIGDQRFSRLLLPTICNDVRDATKLDDKEKAAFHFLMAKAMYIISFLSTRVQAPDSDHGWNKLQRFLKYLNGTRDMVSYSDLLMRSI